MELGLAKVEGNRFSVRYGQKDLGYVEIKYNDFHAENCYIALELQEYDASIATLLFEKLATFVEGDLQVMVSSDDEMVDFFIAGGFECKRKCYELEVGPEDLKEEIFSKTEVKSCSHGDSIYEQCCKLMYEYYSETHQCVSPLTAPYEKFVEILPEKVLYQELGGKIVSAVFVEENEIAYMCSMDEVNFQCFASAVIDKMFQEHDEIFFECDNCDWAAMALKNLFTVVDGVSYNTYVYSRG